VIRQFVTLKPTSEMRKLFFLLCGLLAILPAAAQKMTASKKSVIQSVEAHQAELIAISDSIWAMAETAFQETGSSKLLADYAEANGFRVERGVAGIPTAFMATYGSGQPVISVLGEFDALPGISQKAQPTKEPLHEGAAGHGCGHTLFGTASLASAIAI
jgi:aminobenzoyl-glutamate utilization protein B